MPTKREIAEVALDLFMKDGYNGVSIKNITDALNITKGSLYYHYTGKEALFEETAELFLNNIYSRIGISIPDEVVTVRGMFDHFVKLYGEAIEFLGSSNYDMGYIHMIIQGKRNSELLKDAVSERYEDVEKKIRKVFEDDIRNGAIKKLNADLDNIASGFIAMFEGYILMWMNTNDNTLKGKLSALLDTNFKALTR